MCTTIVNGSGGDCATGNAIGSPIDYPFPGRWTPTTVSVCGHSWTSLRDEQGNLHPNWQYWAFYSPTFSIRYEGCGISTAQKFDCINGGCVPAETYKTPGFYANLAACQSGCAKNSPCNGECVDAAELAQLQQAVGNIKNRICG